METEYQLKDVCRAIKKSWCKKTCYLKFQPNWTRKNASYGQDVVSCLILYDYFKGNIKKCNVEGVPHYFNMIHKDIIDLTAKQFHGKNINYENSTYKKRSDLLENKNVNDRYLLLKEKVETLLNKERLSKKNKITRISP